jgi:hypothetical protein
MQLSDLDLPNKEMGSRTEPHELPNPLQQRMRERQSP